MNKKKLGALIGVIGSCGILMMGTFFVNNNVSKRVFHNEGYVEAASTRDPRVIARKALMDRDSSEAFDLPEESSAIEGQNERAQNRVSSVEKNNIEEMDAKAASNVSDPTEEEAPIQTVNEDREKTEAEQRAKAKAEAKAEAERKAKAEAEARAKAEEEAKAKAEAERKAKAEAEAKAKAEAERKAKEEAEAKAKAEAERKAKEEAEARAKAEAERKAKAEAKAKAKAEAERKAKAEKNKKESSNSQRIYTLSRFKHMGVINWSGYKFTYYSQKVLPGYNLRIPGRHVNEDGFVCDKDGYIVLAHRTVARGTVINTPFGHQGKVYDRGSMSDANHYDVYVD